MANTNKSSKKSRLELQYEQQVAETGPDSRGSINLKRQMDEQKAALKTKTCRVMPVKRDS